MSQLKSRRFEARIDPRSDDAISKAADLVGESKSTFIVKAARHAADRVLARNDVGGISQVQFDELVEAITDSVIQKLQP